MNLVNAVLVVLQLMFIASIVFIEQPYCTAPLSKDDDRFLIKTTVEYCEEHNRLFLSRPRWVMMATCMSAYGFLVGYIAIAITALADLWSNRLMSTVMLLFVGAKMYALAFYHIMNFTSDTPPQHSLQYWGAEGPYVVSALLVAIKCSTATTPNAGSSKKKIN